MKAQLSLGHGGLGSSIIFVRSIVNSRSRNASERVKVAQLLKSKTHYDAEEYLGRLISASETLLAPFGYTKEQVKTEAMLHERQILLH